MGPVGRLRFLIEYSGQIVSAEEAARRAKQRAEEDPSQHNYIFTLNEYTGTSGKNLKTF